jgi:hypothetical protein
MRAVLRFFFALLSLLLLVLSLGFAYPTLKMVAIAGWLADVRLGGKRPELRIRSFGEAYSMFFKSLCGMRSAQFNAALDRKILLVSVNDADDDDETDGTRSPLALRRLECVLVRLSQYWF